VEKYSTEEGSTSRVTWEHLEEFARGKIQSWLQSMLEEEVTESLGRKKSERRPVVDVEGSVLG
jgi:putative transposase